MAYEFQRDEWRASLRGTVLDCRNHDYRPTANGGGICAGCGDKADRDEL